MHYLSKERPKSHFRSAFVTSKGEPVVPLFFPQIEPVDEQLITLIWWLPCPEEFYSSSAKTLKIPLSWLQEVLQEYMDNPESFLKDYLSYSFKLPSKTLSPNKRHKQEEINLEDL
jgi:hypothetical protein